jgi:hypothetical protein
LTPFHPAGRTHDSISRESIRRFAAALPEPLYLVSLHHAGQARTVQHHWPPARIEAALGWLRARNCQGWHIHGRPWSPRHLVLDDLTLAALERLAAQYRPAAVVATSPNSLQAWLTVSPVHVALGDAAAVARLLARRFSADTGATAPFQPGRWPGFTNPKPAYADGNGRFPFARLIYADGPCVTPGAADLIAEAREASAHAAAGRTSLPPLTQTARLPRRGRLTPRTPEAEAAEATRRVAASLPPRAALDRSRIDAAIARRLFARGASPAYVAATIAAGAKAGGLCGSAADAYVARTVAAAMRDTAGLDGDGQP